MTAGSALYINNAAVVDMGDMNQWWAATTAMQD